MDTILIRMYKLAVWDSFGRMYMPIIQEDGEVLHYCRAQEVINHFYETYIQKQSRKL